ncbi:MAG: hypothetical protein UR73_C0038G0019 [candidate division WS6 bacterium GW2011_GWF1_35_23]|uniref:Uncharacterized protein n=1 Tax=candidate division WS6 bacterium GW2011_GWF1_35_23 TaxID=1619097 RepID=A0A0G0CEY7_9BACT|nr:MAG: hypothetical protein UR73_C0038G0019 [candidate division WS6 bacterium GW2011_GWF1_35_23]KKQ29803.1 MAG: hypothetical protein US46_C0017G0019 [Candidatus Shapirobacteria bacterium GW2011_GWF2_37_20]
MGWCSGTPIFDKTAKLVLSKETISYEDKKEILKTLVDAMRDHDWDCEHDSELCGNPIVDEVLGFDDDDDE